MESEFKSIDDLDAQLAAEFSIKEDAVDDTAPVNDTNEEEKDEGTEEKSDEVLDALTDKEPEKKDTQENEGNEKPIETEKSAKPAKEEKADYSFAKLRQEKSEIEKKLNEELAFWKDLAAEYNYTDLDKFKADYREAKIRKEAMDKGKDPELYKEVIGLKEEISSLKQENQKVALQEKASATKTALDKAVEDYALGEGGLDLIFERLDKAGYAPEVLLNSPNPRTIIDGVLIDKIQEKVKQDQIKKMEKLENLSDEKHENSASGAKLSLDEIVNAELKDYAKNYY